MIRKLRNTVSMLLVSSMLCSTAFGEVYRVNPDDELMDSRSAIELIETVYTQYIDQEAQDKARIREISVEELDVMDIERPITIVTPEGSLTVTVAPSQAVIRRSIEATADAELAYVGKLSYATITEMIAAGR